MDVKENRITRRKWLAFILFLLVLNFIVLYLWMAGQGTAILNREIKAAVGMSVGVIGIGCSFVFFTDIFVELRKRNMAWDPFSLIGLPNTPKVHIISGIVFLVGGGVILMCVIAEYSFAEVIGSLM